MFFRVFSPRKIFQLNIIIISERLLKMLQCTNDGQILLQIIKGKKVRYFVIRRNDEKKKTPPFFDNISECPVRLTD